MTYSQIRSTQANGNKRGTATAMQRIYLKIETASKLVTTPGPANAFGSFNESLITITGITTHRKPLPD